jgi:hypothetical protein
MIAYNCNPSHWEVEIKRVTVQGKPEQKVREMPFQQISGALWLSL